MKILAFILFVPLLSCAQVPPRQDKVVSAEPEIVVGGRCEGCEAALEYGDRQLHWVDTLQDYIPGGPRIKVSGTIYKRDGKTPAKDIILYVYHTDQTGVYPTHGGETDWGRRHGYLRTWLRTNDSGQYAFYTLRPASYPNSRNPAHIHATIKEPGKTAYWIDEYLFDDDPFLTAEERSQSKIRGSYGVLKPLKVVDGVTEYQRDIILGLNVENYH